MDYHPHGSYPLNQPKFMKFFNALLLTLFTSGLALAAPPKTHRSDRYKDLYLRSAITDPPPPIVKEKEPTDLPDWVLVGLTKYVGKTEVQIMNIKDRSRLRIPSPEASELGFSVKKVVQDRNYLKHSVVTLQKGNDVGEVRFDPKFLVLKKIAGPSGSAARRPTTGNRSTTGNRTPTGRTGRTGGSQPPTPGRTTPGTRTRTSTTTPTRPGSVPRPTTGSNGGTTTTTSATNDTTTKSKRTRYVPRPTK